MHTAQHVLQIMSRKFTVEQNEVEHFIDICLRVLDLPVWIVYQVNNTQIFPIVLAHRPVFVEVICRAFLADSFTEKS